MQVVIKNKSSKIRSKKQQDELVDFAKKIAKEFNIDKKIKKINLTYRDNWVGYYPKGKPLAGFFKAWNGSEVNIDFVGFWDKNLTQRKEAIIHELTHTKQMINKELVVFKTGRTLKWKGILYNKWKTWKESEISEIKSYKKRLDYHLGKLPWEIEVSTNVKKYLNKEVFI